MNRFPNPKEADKPLFVRKQCMHCNQPSCGSACLCKAMTKTPEGPVVYHKDRCMGCRYCMVSCPFDIPKFQYGSNSPFIQKCQFCYEKQAAGEQPACSSACPEGATLFGTRRELIEVAKERIYQNPGKYVPHVYGEHEVGGTSMLFISPEPFDKIGFPTNVGTKPYPELTSGFLFSVPHVDILWPALMFGFVYLIKGNGDGGHHG
jgi:Fe-S-cluster-containing dehydrogenase component